MNTFYKTSSIGFGAAGFSTSSSKIGYFGNKDAYKTF
jgi:hypothetical protein